MTNRRTYWRAAALTAVPLLLVACGSGHRDMMSGPSGMGTTAMPSFLSVNPPGNATGVSVNTVVTLRFSVPMANGMEQLIDLHEGDLSGPVVPMGCTWSGDRAVLTCVPSHPLRPATRYTIHLGGGLTAQNGQPIGMTQYGPMYGGQSVTGGMMGSSHAGSPWSMMGNGWHDTNGGYGMAFTFTTG